MNKIYLNDNSIKDYYFSFKNSIFFNDIKTKKIQIIFINIFFKNNFLFFFYYIL